MTPLFSDAGKARLTAIVRPGVLCVFDFDGTLAPIVAQPDQARIPLPILAQLQALQKRTSVAILTGRSLADIGSRLGFVPDFVVGNHGLEGLPGSSEQRALYATQCAGWRDALTEGMRDATQFGPGFVMEDKQISLSLHYRHAGDHHLAEAKLRTLIALLRPVPRVIAGKCVLNLLPVDAGDKGTAFNALMRDSGASTALYVGDDVTDEDVFALARPDMLSIRIGETGPTSAPFFLHRYADIARLLDDLIVRLGTTIRPQGTSLLAAVPDPR